MPNPNDPRSYGFAGYSNNPFLYPSQAQYVQNYPVLGPVMQPQIRNLQAYRYVNARNPEAAARLQTQ